ncbi:MAG: hypothetical protein KGO02_20030 [Alphaproteobacteria bacterium]|nr:hypothetical protein [Alphaproteobacteria bacterium]
MADIDRNTIPTAEQDKAMQEQRERAPDIAPTENREAARPPAPSKDDETAALEQALQERHAEEGRQLRQRQNAEYQQTASILADEAREHFGRETYRTNIGFKVFIKAIRETLKPQMSAEKARTRADSVAELDAVQAADLAELTEHHQPQQREHDACYEAERDSYLREHEAAAKLLAEIEERRRQEEEQCIERVSNRDGPPGRAR